MKTLPTLAGFLWLLLAMLPLSSCDAHTELRTPSGPEPAAAVETARRLVTKRHRVATEALRVTGAEAVQWPDRGLGCPQPGMLYAQVITPGYRVTLVDGSGREYVVHLGAGRALLCARNE